jgi:hypothetical protein
MPPTFLPVCHRLSRPSRGPEWTSNDIGHVHIAPGAPFIEARMLQSSNRGPAVQTRAFVAGVDHVNAWTTMVMKCLATSTNAGAVLGIVLSFTCGRRPAWVLSAAAVACGACLLSAADAAEAYLLAGRVLVGTGGCHPQCAQPCSYVEWSPLNALAILPLMHCKSALQ